MSRVQIHQVDSFTDVPFRGNPAAVCVLDGRDDRSRDAGWMQLVAREMNLSETAFVVPDLSGSPGRFSLRWFTPTLEVDLCGHATLAAAHVLWETDVLAQGDAAIFDTASGELRCELEESPGSWIAMDFPAWPPHAWDAAPPALTEAFSPGPAWIGRNKRDAFLVMATAREVRDVEVRVDMLREVDVLGAIVTGPSDAPLAGEGSSDYVARFFAPRAGIDEDPVTGSAYVALGPYWSGRLGSPVLLGEQLSDRRGTVRTRVRGDRVEVAGQAVTTMVGTLLA